jgi:hypothetical protein
MDNLKKEYNDFLNRWKGMTGPSGLNCFEAGYFLSISNQIKVGCPKCGCRIQVADRCAGCYHVFEDRTAHNSAMTNFSPCHACQGSGVYDNGDYMQDCQLCGGCGYDYDDSND